MLFSDNIHELNNKLKQELRKLDEDELNSVNLDVFRK